MSSLLERIAARRAELTEQAQHLTKQLTDVQHELDRVSVGEQVITQMLAEPEPEAVGRDMPVSATGSGQVEGTRAKLNRLAERGWLRKMPNGSFAPMS